ncbi:PLP-dependent aminotransferase family protein [Peribacillus sp. B-H-3]|uniref:MocR-like pyridoxine biosynthesis transcription factor PdxR n=1 Tax=Peribacillus sp. B-H-3 TaxID=3400420 RepID=UPI003B020E96
MLSCQLNRTSEIPLYEQLYLYVKNEIAEGRLEFNTKLPSKRKLSDHLQISQNTVESAYGQLVSEGFLEVRARKGYYVMASEDLEYLRQAGYQNDIKSERKKEVIKYDFHPSQIDTKSFPFRVWRKYSRDMIDEKNEKLLLMGDHRGESGLRQQIAAYLYGSRGVVCTPEQIIIGAGVEILLQQLVLLLEENTSYGVEDPGYHLIYQILKSYGKTVNPLEIDEEGVNVEQIEQSGVQVVYVTPSHHFPYGTILSINRRMKLLNWASASDERYIIEDDYDSEFRYSGKSIPSLQSIDKGDNIIFLGSFSKSLMPSIRISYMILPQSLMDRYQDKLSFYHSTVSRINQQTLAQFMEAGEFEKHLNRMRKVYRSKLEAVVTVLKEYDKKIRVIGANSGLHIVLVIENGLDEETLIEEARKSQIRVYPLSLYSIERPVAPPKVILGFGGIPLDELESAIRALLKSWKID